MAAVASSAVTINGRYNTIANTEGKRQTVDATIVLSSQGGTSNYIGADLLGLAAIDSVESCVSSGDAIYPASPSYDRTKLLLTSTSASAGAATDISATVRVVVTGTPTGLFF